MRVLLWIIILIAGVYSVVLAGIAWTQRSLLYHPRHDSITPAEAGLPKAQVLSLTTTDGETLVAWYVPATSGKPLFLYFHGNGGGLSDRVARFDAMTAGGYGLLAISYRSYFGSTGSITEAGLHIDARAGYAEAQRLGYSADRIVAVGESLGTGVAVALAAEKPVAALILDSPYSSIVDVAAKIYWIFPVRLLMLDPFHSDQWIGNVHAPVLVMHGTNDGIIPLASAQRLFSLANEPKEFITVQGAGHVVLARPEVLSATLRWVNTQIQQHR